MIFRSIADRSEIALLVSCSGKRDASAQWVDGLLDRGESRLGWCRMALTDDGELLAAQVLDSWSPDRSPGRTPSFVQLLGHTDESAAVALLRNDLDEFDAGQVDVRLVWEADAPDDLRALREQQEQVLGAAGFRVQVDRVRLEWSGASRSASGLTFQPAASVPEAELVDVFAAVGDGSVDYEMVTGRAEHGRADEAVTRLGRARRRRYEDDWFVVGVTADGVSIGYVQVALVDNGRAILAEVGVAEPHRGNRYVDELLAYGTCVLAACGERHIQAFTDARNRGMRAAFARGGYAETGTRRDFRRPAPAPTQK